MLKVTKDQLKYVDELIRSATPFENGSENYKLCWQYVISHLKHHRFIDSNQQNIDRIIHNLVEKFTIHSQDSKARSLQTIYSNVISAPLSDGGHTKTDTHYAVVAFLLHMQQTPLSAQYEGPVPLQCNTSALETDENWYDVLTEDMDGLVRHDYAAMDSDHHESFSDDDAEAEPGPEVEKSATQPPSSVLLLSDPPPVNIHTVVPLPLEDDLSTIDIHTLLTQGPMHGQYTRTTESVMDAEQWLEDYCQPEYWQRNDIAVTVTHPRSNKVLEDWEGHLRKVDPESLGPQRVEMTEYQVIREVLWMLLGAEDSFLFKGEYNTSLLTKNLFVVFPSCSLCHMTNGALDRTLFEFAKWGSMTLCFRKFADYVDANLRVLERNSQAGIPHTIRTFASQMRIFVTHFRKSVQDIELKVRGENTLTLMMLYTELRPWFQRLSIMRDILLGASAGRFEALHWEVTAVALLDLLYEAICSLETTCEDRWMLQWTKMVFMNTFQPYLYSVDALLSGQPCSSIEELFLLKQTNVNVKDQAYWDEGYTLKKFDGQRILSVVPKIFHKFVAKLIITIKSMDLLKAISEEEGLPEVLSTVITEPGSFIEKFNADIQVLPKTDSSKVEKNKPPFKLGNFSLENVNEDPLCMTNFMEIFHSMHKDIIIPKKLDSVVFDQEEKFRTEPLQSVLRESIGKLICERHKVICNHLLVVILNHLNLRRCFDTLRAVFLMEAGDVMHEFTWDIFENIRLREPWRDCLALNLRLRRCLEGRFGKEVTNFWITSEAEKQSHGLQSYSLEAFDIITLTYKARWPLCFVITPKCLKMYNDILQFLMQVKRVKHCLDHLHISELVGLDADIKLDKKTKQLVHRCQILRVKLLHIVNSLHQFIMNRIAQSHTEFEQSLLSAEDLVDLASIHYKFILSVHRCCLLDKEVGTLRNSLLSVLGLAIDLQQRWIEGAADLSDKKLSLLEGNSQQYIVFLTGLFSKAVEHGALPHLAPLAFAFQACGESFEAVSVSSR